MNDIALTAFTYLLHPHDRNEFVSLAAGANDADGGQTYSTHDEKALERFDPTHLSKNRRLLLAGYLALYSHFRTDSDIRERRSGLMRKMELPPALEDKIDEGVSLFGASLIPAPDSPIKAVLRPENAVVKQMTALVASLSLGRQYVFRNPVDGLAPQEYEHDLDRQFLNILQNTMGFEKVVRLVLKHGLERFYTIAYTGSNLRLGPEQMSDAYETVQDACSIIDLRPVPDAYVQQGFINAGTFGAEKPMLFFDSGCFGALDESELMFIVGHELGHIKSGHCLYHMISDLLINGALSPLLDTVAAMTLGISGVVMTGVEIAILNWKRMSEFTADRAGLLCCQDIDAALRLMVKMAGIPPSHYGSLNVEAFKEQAREFREFDFNTRDKIIKVLSILGASHPWTVMRAHELLKWHESGEYQKVLERKTRIHGANSIRKK